MQMFIPTVLSALETLLKGPTRLLWKVISIFFGSGKSPPPPPIPSLALCSLSDSPYECAHSQHQRSCECTHSQQQRLTYHLYPPPRPAAKYSQSPSAHQPPSRHTPYQPRPSVRLPAVRVPQVPAVIEPRERPTARAPQVSVVPVVNDPHERRAARAPQVPVAPIVIDPHERPATRAPEVSVARVVIDPYEDHKSLRSKAIQEGDHMRKCFKERDEAKARNERQRAKELTQRGKAHEVNMILLNKEASAKIFQENNQNRRNEVDLHGLHVPEALSYFDISVQKARDLEESSLCVIVGKGNHSDNNAPKIKPAIQARGESLGLSIEVDPRNDGRLIVSFR
ncbi:uncharacterized protein BJ212DRAFT_208249 [Suillus subaureus]|uniref:Smr domain-containing protein n=1 Tax=Suillus subaureus TaxID=48587 RepID=A0A9P7EAP6_9AGAM|nr:uncharacterized protein BJ212DRAFT_208249 [Suillus subaureus]KAG1816050.1 hypothetical protein BJ212DRAFT_208249 [Suillus subaureus]